MTLKKLQLTEKEMAGSKVKSFRELYAGLIILIAVPMVFGCQIYMALSKLKMEQVFCSVYRVAPNLWLTGKDINFLLRSSRQAMNATNGSMIAFVFLRE